MPINLSSRTFFHYTKNISSLQSILKYGLKFSSIGEIIPGTSPSLSYYTEAICLCDIPLSMIDEHVKWYGHYGIGINAEYCKKKGASPVQYIHAQTPYLKHKGNDLIGYYNSYAGLQYLKRINGVQRNNNDEYQKKYFYDEKEWRIINNDAGQNSVLDNQKTIKEIDNKAKELNQTRKGRERYWPYKNQAESEHDRKEYSNFLKKNVDYIILDKESEIPQFINWMREEFSEYEILLPRIITLQAINDDI